MPPLNVASNSDLRQSIGNQGAVSGVCLQGQVAPPAQLHRLCMQPRQDVQKEMRKRVLTEQYKSASLSR